MSEIVTVPNKDLGAATAYGYAKLKGYTGTEEEFAALMASYASVAEDAAESARDAEDAQEAAEDAQEAAENARDQVLGMSATAETLPAGSDASASYSGGVLTIGVPVGADGADGVGIPAGGQTNQVLAKASDDSYDTTWVNQSGGGGSSDYTDLTNKPQINGHTLSGNQSAADLGLGTYSKPSSGIPKTDLASAVQTSLGKADSAYQKPSSGIPGTDLASGVVPSPSDSTPQALGTAAAGSSANYSRADHVHPMPSASDVGAVTPDDMASAISQSTAFFRGSFATKAALLAVAWQTSDPEAANYVTNNDYAVVLDDETQNDECWRYIYVSGTGWTDQYKINETPLTQAQLDALNSGATAAIITSISSKAEDFWCTYGTTTSAQIEAAYQAGKIVKLKYSDKIYELVYRGASTSHTFAAPYNGSSPCIYGVYCSSDVWSASSAILIPAPASPTGGQILGYNGSAWVAETPAPEVTVSTAGDVTQALDAGKIYHFTGAISSLTLTLNAAPTGRLAQYHFDFDSGSTPATVTLAGVSWLSGSFSPEASKHYEVDILNGYGVYLAW